VDTVFSYTAPHTAPTNANGRELPDAAALDARNAPHIHWVFMDANSHHVINGDFPVTADDVVVFDWQQIVTANPDLSDQTGYLVFTTNAGWNGQAANFSFFADAYFVTDANVGAPDGQDFYSSVNIPALPLADGNDDGATIPTLDNNVIISVGQDAIVSPLVSGIRTSIVNTKDEFTVVDLELANGNANPFSTNTQDAASLLVVWNDRNATNWSRVGVNVFDHDEHECSSFLRLPYELNVTWVPYGGWPNAGTDTGYDNDYPGFIDQDIHGTNDPQGFVSRLCDPTTSGVNPESFTQFRLEGGFVKVRLPEPMADGQTAVQQSAAAAFTINFGLDANAGQGYATETVLGHDRGKFTGR
jgi:hypothetical protein